MPFQNTFWSSLSKPVLTTSDITILKNIHLLSYHWREVKDRAKKRKYNKLLTKLQRKKKNWKKKPLWGSPPKDGGSISFNASTLKVTPPQGMYDFKEIDFEILYLANLISKPWGRYLWETLKFLERRRVLIKLQGRRISSIFLAFQTISSLAVEDHGYWWH